MKDQGQMMNQPPPQMMNQSQMMSMSQPPQLLSQPPPQQVLNNSQKSQMRMIMNPSQIMMNQSQSQSQMLNRGTGGGYGMWPQPVDQLKFQNPMKPPPGFVSRNKNWKLKKGNNDKRNNQRKVDNANANPLVGVGSSSGGGYKPPTLKELQQQNRLKARRYFPKKKYNNLNSRSAPFAPRNTTSFLIRAKKAGGITSLVSPCPVTPAVLPTPIFSPSREVLVDMAKEEWGVDGYGSMKGLIRLRSPGNEADAGDDEDEEEGGSSESDVEEHVEVERRLDHDLSRFEMIYPNSGGVEHSNYLLENRVDDQDTHIAQLEEENLILKERLFLMEREFEDLRMRLQCLERQSRVGEGYNEEVVENDSENESESRGYGRSMEENVEDAMDENNNEGNNQHVDAVVKEVNNMEKNDDTSKNVNVCVSAEDHMQGKEEKGDAVEVADAEDGNNDQIVEAKQDSNLEGSNNVDVADVRIKELGPVKDEILTENQSKDEEMQNEQ